jgi:hypothetical protein
MRMTKQAEVRVGQVWLARVSGRMTTVRITNIRVVPGYRTGYVTRPSVWRADAINETTGKAVLIKSAQKLRKLVRDVNMERIGGTEETR